MIEVLLPPPRPDKWQLHEYRFIKRHRGHGPTAHLSYRAASDVPDQPPTEDEEVAKLYQDLQRHVVNLMKNPHDMPSRAALVRTAQELTAKGRLTDDQFSLLAATLGIHPAALPELLGEKPKK